MTEIELLNQSITQIEAKTQSKEWVENLEPRKKEEAEFHDFSHDQSTELENKKFYKTTEKSNIYLQNWLKENVKDKIFLDYACGNGDAGHSQTSQSAVRCQICDCRYHHRF